MIKHALFKSTAVLLALCFLFAFAIALPQPVLAAAKITETVNATLFIRNTSGSGYYWDNRYDTLTIDGLYIDTSDEYGLKVPAGATIILKGNSYIKASHAALALAGTATFKGSGSLTLVSDNMGIYCYATDQTSVIRVLEGTYDITAGGDGIYSTNTSISFVGGKWKISAPTATAYAVNGTDLKLYGGKITADNSIHASVSLDVQAIDLTVTSEKAALSSDKALRLLDVSVSAGDTASSLSKADEYAGENCVTLRSTHKNVGKSIFFGDAVPKFVDYVVLVLILALVAAGIAVPLARTHKKAKAALAAAKAAEEEAEAARRAAKKNRN